MRLRWTRLAEGDLEAIAAFIGQDNPVAATRVILELLEQIESVLAPNPAIGRPGRVLGTREFVIAGLPYIIAYRMRDQDLQILRVLHTSRRWPADF